MDFHPSFLEDIQMRYSPQNTSDAISHLCCVTKATHLICHPSLLQLGQAATEGSSEISIVHLALRAAWDTPSLLLRPALEPTDEKDLSALVMHTSGSTGMPKVCLYIGGTASEANIFHILANIPPSSGLDRGHSLYAWETRVYYHTAFPCSYASSLHIYLS